MRLNIYGEGPSHHAPLAALRDFLGMPKTSSTHNDPLPEWSVGSWPNPLFGPKGTLIFYKIANGSVEKKFVQLHTPFVSEGGPPGNSFIVITPEFADDDYTDPPVPPKTSSFGTVHIPWDRIRKRLKTATSVLVTNSEKGVVLKDLSSTTDFLGELLGKDSPVHRAENHLYQHKHGEASSVRVLGEASSVRVLVVCI